MEGIYMKVFGIMGLISCMKVVRGENEVNSVLYLVWVFVNATGMLLVLEVEYMGMLYIVVYVGAIAILFLFVVMMLGGNSGEKGGVIERVLRWVVGLWVVREIVMWEGVGEGEGRMSWEGVMDGVTNMERMGQMIYTEKIGEFLIGGLVLLVALIGCVVMVMWDRPGIYSMRKEGGDVEDKRQERQELIECVRRDPRSAVFMVERDGGGR
uniref:NADH-ubiquinone oxidoreductase chain 6 n=1 Tax=Labyrinthula sp. TaxID=1678526 RepID=A0A7S6ZP76_9STRA|nr:NADH dehydrogenase subunit 6 [Labyrinthula sp.]